MPIDEAYKLFCLTPIHEAIKFLQKDIIMNTLRGDFALLRESIEYFIESFDYSILDGLFEQLEQKIQEFDFVSLQQTFNEAVGGLKIH